MWYNAGSDGGSIDNHVDSDFRETGKFCYMNYTELILYRIIISNQGKNISISYMFADPLREINSYNHGSPIHNSQETNDINSNNNNYHFSTSYEYEPSNIDNGTDNSTNLTKFSK